MNPQSEWDGSGDDELLSVPDGASREDLLAVKSLAEELLKNDPERDDARRVIAQVEKVLAAPPTAPARAVPPPASAPQRPAPAAPPTAPKYPGDINRCYEMLRQLQQMPERTETEEKIKAARLAPLKDHIHRIQQGLPTLSTEAESYGNAVGKHAHSLKRHRLEVMARTSVEVKELLAERDSLAKENESLKQQLKK
jgi:hypothetical protein